MHWDGEWGYEEATWTVELDDDGDRQAAFERHLFDLAYEEGLVGARAHERREEVARLRELYADY